MNLSGRSGSADGGITRPGKVINIPTGEAFIAPLEKRTEGTLVINGSFNFTIEFYFFLLVVGFGS